MAHLDYDFHSMRAQKARTYVRLQGGLVTLLAWLCGFLVVGGAGLLVVGWAVGWLVMSCAALPYMIVIWYYHDLKHLPTGKTDAVTDVLSGDILGQLPETPSPRWSTSGSWNCRTTPPHPSRPRPVERAFPAPKSPPPNVPKAAPTAARRPLGPSTTALGPRPDFQPKPLELRPPTTRYVRDSWDRQVWIQPTAAQRGDPKGIRSLAVSGSGSFETLPGLTPDRHANSRRQNRERRVSS